MRQITLFLLLCTCLTTRAATEGDTARHVGYSVFVLPQWQIAMDEYERKWLRDKFAFSFGAELNYRALPSDNDAFAEDYNYPTLSAGLKLSLNNGVTMRRTADPSWGKAQMVDYDSRLGDMVTLYGSFTRPLLRRGRWELNYMLRAGVGYGPFIYNKKDNIDNELIGSAFNIYFGAGITASYQITSDLAITAGLLYGHHSNGALARPNKGENHFGPMVGVRSLPTAPAPHTAPDGDTNVCRQGIGASSGAVGGAYLDFRLGLGGKTLLEDWQKTQFYTEPGEPDYRTEDFHFYMSYSASAAFMYRYARRWASGIGADVYYGTYYKHVRDLDEAAGRTVPHSPWSIGISARHEVYYHNLSLDLALGIYLHRQMGSNAKEVEQPYYERVGVFYTFPKLGHLKIGASVQAHRTKADLTELQVSFPVRL